MTDRGGIFDPEGVETRTIHDLIDFAGKDVLEIGCGDGRMTWRYAESTRSVLAIDPDEDSIAVAREQTPGKLKSRVAFMAAGITDVELAENGFDVAILSWSIWCIPEESVVDALNIVHRALRPGGMLLDIHPRAVPSPFDVRLEDGTKTSLGKSEYNGSFSDTIAAAEKVLEQQEADGRLVDEQHAEFEVLHHFATAEHWQTYRAVEAAYYVPVTGELLVAVDQAMAPSGAVLLMGEAVRATRYRAIG